jgi:hypothetical protein
LWRLESETREPDCIVSNTFCTGCKQRTFVFRKFAGHRLRRKRGIADTGLNLGPNIPAANRARNGG